MSLFGSLAYGIAGVFHPRMLWLMVWPMLVSLALWGGVAVVLWGRTTAWLAATFDRWMGAVPFLGGFDLGMATLVAANVAVFLLFVPLVWMTALLILGTFGMQRMVDHVAGRSFPALDRRRGGGTVGSLWNAAVALMGMLGLFAITLPLWLLPFLWPLIPLGVMGWVNQRLLRYDALGEHADREEMARLFRERRGALYLLGVLLGAAAFVPVAGFLAPAAFSLAAIHYLLGALSSLRAPMGAMRTKNWIEGNGGR